MGNSSSGIIEAPSLKTPTLNLEKGRMAEYLHQAFFTQILEKRI